jgi:hypothetical protein
MRLILVERIRAVSPGGLRGEFGRVGRRDRAR